jgi:undecaprenyl-diphosphatase
MDANASHPSPDPHAHGRPSGWVVARGASRAWRRFRDDWRRHAPQARRRFIRSLILGWVACAALAVGLAVGARALASQGMDAWDLRELQSLLADSPMSFQSAIWFEGWGSSAMLIPVTIVSIVLAALAGRALYAAAIAAAYVLHDPLIFLIHWIWPRVRPDLVADGIASPPLNAFPSGHTVQVIAVYGLLAWMWARRSGSAIERTLALVCIALLTATVAYARLRLGTHWPSDVLGAVPLGLAWLLVCIVAIRSAERLDAAAR